jgi:hypothetical protein
VTLVGGTDLQLLVNQTKLIMIGCTRSRERFILTKQAAANEIRSGTRFVPDRNNFEFHIS